MQYVFRLFKKGNVCVTGLRGMGKDVLTGNALARLKKPYASNLDYGGEYVPLDLSSLDLGGNTYDDFIKGDLKYYRDPYFGKDIVISDAGVYFPSQFCNELNKKYPGVASYMALSRQIGRHNCHINVQNLNRLYDKIREQSDIYIRCRGCFFLFGKIVFLKWTEYDKLDSCIARINPCRVSVPLFADKATKLNAEMHLDSFYNAHGLVKNHLSVFFNRSSHDTYYFEKLLINGKGKPNECI